jgi:hypothetical protein
MIPVTELIARARKAGVVFTVEGATVKCRLPKPAGIKIAPLMDEIRRRRDEVKAAFKPAVSVVESADPTADEVDEIVAVWHRVLGFSASREHVAANLRQIRIGKIPQSIEWTAARNTRRRRTRMDG